MNARRPPTKTITLVALLLLVAACSDPVPTTRPPDSELREQIHAATGHEPANCTDFTSGDAEITITDTGFEPECSLVAAGAALTVTNTSANPHTFTVGDPANNVVGRHIRVDESLAPDASYDLAPVDDLLGPGIYPFWSKGDQEAGYNGTVIVRP